MAGALQRPGQFCDATGPGVGWYRHHRRNAHPGRNLRGPRWKGDQRLMLIGPIQSILFSIWSAQKKVFGVLLALSLVYAVLFPQLSKTSDSDEQLALAIMPLGLVLFFVCIACGF